MKLSTIREASEAYLVWAKQNRTEKFWKRQERILREDVLPVIGDLPIKKALWDLPGSVLALSPDQTKRGLAAHNAVGNVISWTLKQFA